MLWKQRTTTTEIIRVSRDGITRSLHAQQLRMGSVTIRTTAETVATTASTRIASIATKTVRNNENEIEIE